MKNLMKSLEDSVVEQIKIPQIQLLHTELQRLKDLEERSINKILKRKEELKNYKQANGGRLPKDDGMGAELRKDQR